MTPAARCEAVKLDMRRPGRLRARVAGIALLLAALFPSVVLLAVASAEPETDGD
jgi:hypothetical protein